MTYVVGVQFKNRDSVFCGSIYHFLCDDDISLKVRDYAVVQTQYGPSLGRVHSLHSTAKAASQYVIQAVDMNAYEQRRELERRRKVIETKLKVMEEELLAKERFRFLATNNPEAAELLRELETLS